MSGSIRDFLKIAGISVVTLLLLAALFVGVNKATATTDKVYEKMDNIAVMIDESDYTKYDGAIVSGSDVIASVKQADSSNDKINICVKTKKNTGGTNYICQSKDALDTPATTNIMNAYKKESNEYINPGGQFLGEVIRDDNDTIVQLLFTQQ